MGNILDFRCHDIFLKDIVVTQGLPYLLTNWLAYLYG